MVWGTDSKRTGVEHNRTLAYEVCKRWNIPKGGDVKPLLELFHDDATFTNMARSDNFPELGGTRTKEQFEEFLGASVQNRAINLQLRGITAQEDRLALECTSDMHVNGHHYNNTYHYLFEIRDGKIAHARFYLDTFLTKKLFEWIAETSEE